MYTVMTPIKYAPGKVLDVDDEFEAVDLVELIGEENLQPLVDCGALVENNPKEEKAETSAEGGSGSVTTGSEQAGTETVVIPLEPVEKQERPADEVDVLAAIKDIAGRMLAEDEGKLLDAWWKKDGAPEVKALESFLGYGISAKERDVVWDLVAAE